MLNKLFQGIRFLILLKISLFYTFQGAGPYITKGLCLLFLRRLSNFFLIYTCISILNYLPLGRGLYDPRDLISAKLNLLVPKMFHANTKSIQAST